MLLFIENDKKILYSNLESSTHVSSALLDAAALILSMYLLK